MKFIQNEIHLLIKAKIIYTDSQCVLYWLQTKRPLSVFVTNRFKEIISLEGTVFRYVPTQENPTNLATRGKTPKLNSSIWWNGPPWLCKPQHLWPESKLPEFDKDSDEVIAEVSGRKALFEAKLVAGEDPTENLTQKINLSDINIEKFSSLQRLL